MQYRGCHPATLAWNWNSKYVLSRTVKLCYWYSSWFKDGRLKVFRADRHYMRVCVCVVTTKTGRKNVFLCESQKSDFTVRLKVGASYSLWVICSSKSFADGLTIFTSIWNNPDVKKLSPLGLGTHLNHGFFNICTSNHPFTQDQHRNGPFCPRFISYRFSSSTFQKTPV